MATYYADSGAAGGGDGSSGTPFNTLAACVAVAAAGDTFNLKGTFYETDIDFLDKGDNITIQQWAGQTAAWVRGDTVLTSWTQDGGCYKKTITASLYVTTVVVNWLTQITTKGHHYGHLSRVSSKANCQATDNSWYYDSATGELDIRIGTNANPSGYTVSYCGYANTGHGKNGISLGSTTATPCQNARVTGIKFGMFCYPYAGYGYPLRFSSCQNSYSKGNEYHDSGYHSLGFVNYNGVAMRNCKSIDESAYGIVANGDSLYVAYCDTGTMDVDSGFENCYGLLEPYLDMSGSPVTWYNPESSVTQITSATVQGIICHTNNALNISRFRCKSCLIIVGTVHSSMTNRMGSYRIAGTTQPSNKLNQKTYGAWLDRCDTLNGVLALFKDSAAWTDSIIHLSQAGTSGSSRVTNGGVLGDNTACYDNAWMLWKACDIRVDLDISTVAADHSMIWQVRGNTGTSKAAQMVLINNSVLNTSMSTASQVRGIFNHIITAGSSIYARGNIFMHRLVGNGSANHNNLTYNNSGIDTPGELALLDFKDNYYINMDDDRYASGTYVNDKTEFDDIDTTGVYESGTNPFRDNSGYSPLELNTYGKSKTAFFLPNCTEGINRRAFSKNYGAYQYGPEATTIPPL